MLAISKIFKIQWIIYIMERKIKTIKVEMKIAR